MYIIGFALLIVSMLKFMAYAAFNSAETKELISHTLETRNVSYKALSNVLLVDCVLCLIGSLYILGIL